MPAGSALIRIGEVYFQWDSKDRHYLAVDLTGPLPEWVVEADPERTRQRAYRIYEEELARMGR